MPGTRFGFNHGSGISQSQTKRAMRRHSARLPIDVDLIQQAGRSFRGSRWPASAGFPPSASIFKYLHSTQEPTRDKAYAFLPDFETVKGKAGQTSSKQAYGGREEDFPPLAFRRNYLC